MIPYRRRRAPAPVPSPPHPDADRVLADAQRMLAELEPGDVVVGVCLNVLSAGQIVLYGLLRGQEEISRNVYTGEPGALRRAAEALGEAFTDATPRGEP
jgi:hypothetical protein